MGLRPLRGIGSTLGRLLRGGTDAGIRPSRPRRVIEGADSIVYAIGDVHGCYDLLRSLEDAVIRDGEQFAQRKYLVMLGDYVDRGPDSSGVLTHLIGTPPDGFERICLCGNHDSEMLRFLEDPDAAAPWLQFGCEPTLRSYNLDIAWLRHLFASGTGNVRELLHDAIPPEHIEFLRTLPVMASFGDVVFAHAGIRPGVPLTEQTDDDLMWIRKPFLSTGPMLPVTVVHGHTPVDAATIERDRIAVDTGAFKTGRLTAVRIHERNVSVLQTPIGT